MKRIFGAGLILATTLLAVSPRAQPPAPLQLAVIYAQVDQLFKDYMALRHVPGAAWGVIVDGEVRHVGVSGFRDVPSQSPVDADSVFRIASMTKSFTAISIFGASLDEYFKPANSGT